MALDYNLVTWSGTTDGGDQWSSSCAYNTDFGTGPVKTSADLTTWAAAIAALPTTGRLDLAQSIPTNMPTTQVRCAYIDSAGKTAAVGVAAWAWTTTNDPTMPPQCAIVLTLLTDLAGRSHRGRMYWPAGGNTVTGEGRLSAAVRGNIATQAAAYLVAAGSAAGVDLAMIPVVNSKVLGTTTEVTVLRVGDVIDTQRRRRNRLVEAYSSATLGS